MTAYYNEIDKNAHDMPELFNKDPELLQEMYDYCLQDVVVEREISRAVRPLNELEIDDYHVNCRINDRGLLIDTWWAEKAQAFAEEETAEIVAELIAITDGEVTKKQGAGLTNWVLSRLSDEAKDLTIVYKKGEKKHSLDKSVRQNLLLLDDEDPGFLDPVVREVLELASDAAKSSVAKYKRMLDRADPEDERVRGSYLFAGAGQTGRYSSTGAQTHNFPRKSEKDPDGFLDYVEEHGGLPDSDDSVMAQLSSMLRPTIMADDGNTLVCGDWDQIEARVLPWLADDPRAEAGVLKAFRDKDADPSLPGVYELAAAGIYGMDVSEIGPDSEERLIGKIAVLALGFGGGKGAFQSMAKAYGVNMTDERAEDIKEKWRDSNPWAKPFWDDLMRGFARAYRNPQTPIAVGRVVYQYEPKIFNTMFCQLPSGRVISYPDVRFERVDGKWGPQDVYTYLKGSLTPKKGDKEWIRNRVWRGLLAEGPTQATAADILRDALRALDVIDAPVVGDTHDEILIECPEDDAGRWHGTLRGVMLHVPDWAPGLPLNAGLWIGPRYRK